jgi:hypothetical protein
LPKVSIKNLKNLSKNSKLVIANGKNTKTCKFTQTFLFFLKKYESITKLIYRIFATAFSIQTLLTQEITGFLPQNISAQIEWERKFLSLPKASNCERHLSILTEEPHPASSEASDKVVKYIDSVFKSYGLNSKVFEYWAYLPYPEEVSLELTQPEVVKFELKETTWLWDKDT